MLRAVIDTNLLVSYTLSKSKAFSRLIEHWERGSFVYLTSPAIIEELKEVLRRPRLRAKMVADPQPLIDVIEADTEQTSGELILAGVCRDPKDEIFIACAVEGKADYIISWDKDLLDLGEYRDIKIVWAEAFVAILGYFGARGFGSMTELYNLPNIRNLLTHGFNDAELRALCFDLPGFRPVYDQLAQSTGKAEIIAKLLEHAEKTLQLDTLLAIAKERNSARYEKHGPYYTDNPVPALQQQVASLAQRLALLTSPISLTREQQYQVALHWAELGRRDSLAHFDLSETDLTNADLSEANFHEVNLFNANLSGANLCGANLSKTTLRWATLQGTRYNSHTKWPEGFDPLKAGAIRED